MGAREIVNSFAKADRAISPITAGQVVVPRKSISDNHGVLHILGF